ncbi:MAG: CinA family protein [Sporichthyaceae bacterium]
MGTPQHRHESADAGELATAIADRAGALEAKVAVAESLTGGQLCSALAAAPEASTWFRGGVVAYNSEVKHRLLNVPPGPVVCAAAASAMAEGVLATHRATYAVALTGVGGPDPQDGRPPGTVYVAVAGPAGTTVEELRLPGDPEQVCRLAVRSALQALHGALG